MPEPLTLTEGVDLKARELGMLDGSNGSDQKTNQLTTFLGRARGPRIYQGD